jgi:hypothetical protein
MEPARMRLNGGMGLEPIDRVVASDITDSTHQLSNWDLVLFHKMKRRNKNCVCFDILNVDGPEFPSNVFSRLRDPGSRLSRRCTQALRHACGRVGDRFFDLPLSPRGICEWEGFLIRVMSHHYQEFEDHNPHAPPARLCRRAFDLIRMAKHSEKGRFRIIVALFDVSQGPPAWLWGTTRRIAAKEIVVHQRDGLPDLYVGGIVGINGKQGHSICDLAREMMHVRLNAQGGTVFPALVHYTQFKYVGSIARSGLHPGGGGFVPNKNRTEAMLSPYPKDDPRYRTGARHLAPTAVHFNPEETFEVCEMHITLAGAVICDMAIPGELIRAIFCTQRNRLVFSSYLSDAAPVVSTQVDGVQGAEADVLGTPPDASEGPGNFFRCGCGSFIRIGFLICPVCVQEISYRRKIWPCAPPQVAESANAGTTAGGSADGAGTTSGALPADGASPPSGGESAGVTAGGPGGGGAPPPAVAAPALKRSPFFCKDCGAGFTDREAEDCEFVCPLCTDVFAYLDDFPPMNVVRRSVPVVHPSPPAADAGVASPTVQESSAQPSGAGDIPPATSASPPSGGGGASTLPATEGASSSTLGALLDPDTRRFFYHRPVTGDAPRMSKEERAAAYDGCSKKKSKWDAVKKLLGRQIKHPELKTKG